MSSVLRVFFYLASTGLHMDVLGVRPCGNDQSAHLACLLCLKFGVTCGAFNSGNEALGVGEVPEDHLVCTLSGAVEPPKHLLPRAPGGRRLDD
ncbi:MAG: hypothetical protein ACYC6M_15355, partial [Terriglobales bacterium]